MIRVVKSLNKDNPDLSYTGLYWWFDAIEIEREPLIYATDKAEVKAILLEKYPQFFQNWKVYEKETKDTAQFFYVVIYPLFNWEVEMINQWEWKCDSCGHVHENRYLKKTFSDFRLLWEDKIFCWSECIDAYKRKHFSHINFEDNPAYINQDSPNYIYKITEKATQKCYIWKTRNAPFFRWWDHLKHSTSPFWAYFCRTLLSEWTFEVLEVLPPETPLTEVFKVESSYMVKFDSIKNWYNTVISNKVARPEEPEIEKVPENQSQLTI